MTGAVIPIETRYRGYRFRSRLEARWAVFFDAAGIEWEYESEGFDVNGIYYLPDFWLPELQTFVEVKPDEQSGRGAITVLHNLARGRDCHGIIIVGSPDPRGRAMCAGLIDVANNKHEDSDWWLECVFCHHVRLENTKHGSKCRCPADFGLFDPDFERLDTPARYSRLRIEHALSQARCARFEHGEDGTPAPFIAPTIERPTLVYFGGAIQAVKEDVFGWHRKIFPKLPNGNLVWILVELGRLDADPDGPWAVAIDRRAKNNPKNCLEHLCQSDALFVWIDRAEISGAMIELGATFQQKPIFMAFANRALAEKFYFAAQLANVAAIAPSAELAWAQFVRWWATTEAERLEIERAMSA